MLKGMIVILTACMFFLGNPTATPAGEAKEGAEKAQAPVKAEKSPQQQGEEAKDVVVATVGSKKITLKEIEDKLQQIPPQYRVNFRGEEKRKLLENMIDRYLITQEAKRLKIDKIPEVEQKVEDLASNILIQELINREINQKTEITDEEAKKYYDANLDEFKIPEKLKARQILIKVDVNATPEDIARKEATAKEILEKVKTGGDFEAIARENSDDARTKAKGGDMGFITRGRMSAEFDKAAFALKTGEIGDLVKDNEGFHIIKVDEKKEAQQQGFDSVKVRITTKLKREKQKEMVEALIASLKAKNKVTINDELLKAETKEEEAPAAEEQTPEADPQVPKARPEPEKK